MSSLDTKGPTRTVVRVLLDSFGLANAGKPLSPKDWITLVTVSGDPKAPTLYT